jgi:ParB family transcriptional regulator, chromosome partitioning protein
MADIQRFQVRRNPAQNVGKLPPAPKPQTVATDSLQPNPHNPRLLFDRKPLKSLEDSIRKVGILVPITVYRAKGATQYTILDGQRRWICAQHIGLTEVPINEVAEPDVAQNIVTMFQIHKLRKDWELMPTALKLEVLMNELKERRDKVLADLTGLNVAVVGRCKKLLTYPDRYRNMMLSAEPKDRIKADFFIELYPILTDRVLNIRGQTAKNQVTNIMLHKYLNRKSGFKSLTDFRKIKSFISIARNADREDEVRKRFKALLDSDDIDIGYLEIDAARVHREARKLSDVAANLAKSIKGLRTDEYLGEELFWRTLEGLIATIKSKMEDAERRTE